MHKYYKIFAILRIALTFIPQTGYIHPDEYFQSIEVVAEKVFKIQANIPWEFNASYPMRSISSVYLTVGTSYQILKTLDYILNNFYNVTLLTPYFLLLFPRLLMCLFSFVVDWCLYVICSINQESYKSRCLILSISYIMLTYATRTFSNTLELVLFALLLRYVSESLILSTINMRKLKQLQNRLKTNLHINTTTKLKKLVFSLENSSFKNWLIISLILVVGIFNRPTFIAYAAAPIFLWLYPGLGIRSFSTISFYLRLGTIQLAIVPITLLHILIDSFYFGSIIGEDGVKTSINNFIVCTPLNFIKYNFNASNLKEHGLHPFYLHAIVNMPLLFGVLTIFCYLNIPDIIKWVFQSKYQFLPSIQNIKSLMLLSLIIPLGLFSYIPHQEPRFIIPLIVPLVYLYGGKILPETKHVKKVTGASNSHTLSWFRVWVLMNAALTIFYGFLHQGGIYSFISHMQTETMGNLQEYHFITSHVYSIPESLFLERARENGNHVTLGIMKRISIHEQGSKDIEAVFANSMKILEHCKDKSDLSHKIYLVMPYTLLKEFESFHIQYYKHISAKDVQYFYPHISTEKLPTLSTLAYAGSNFYKMFSLVSVELKLSREISDNKVLNI